MQSNDKTLPRVFWNFYPWTHWFNRDNYYWPHSLFVAFKTRFVFFLTGKAFPSCLWASLVFFHKFHLQSWAKSDGLHDRRYFLRVFQASESKREAREERFPRRLCVTLLARIPLAFAGLKTRKRYRLLWRLQELKTLGQFCWYLGHQEDTWRTFGHEIASTEKTPFMYGEKLFRVPLTLATLGESTFYTCPYKTWRNVNMRVKTLARLEGCLAYPNHSFSMVRAPFWPGQLFLI